MTNIFRPYRRQDRKACLAVFDSNVPQFFREHEKPDFEQSLDAFEYPYFVILKEDAIVGCGGYAVSDGIDVADLCWGMVDRRCHSLRLGEFLLLGRLHEISMHAAVGGVRLATSQHTAGFFQRYGFEIKSTQLDGFAPGLDNVEMSLELNTAARTRIADQWQTQSFNN